MSEASAERVVSYSGRRYAAVTSLHPSVASLLALPHLDPSATVGEGGLTGVSRETEPTAAAGAGCRVRLRHALRNELSNDL